MHSPEFISQKYNSTFIKNRNVLALKGYFKHFKINLKTQVHINLKLIHNGIERISSPGEE